MNPYAYAGYDPVNNVDTTGEMFAGIDIRSPRSLRNLLLIPGPGGNNPKEEENDDSSSDDNESSNDNEEKEEENVEKGDDHGWKDGRPVRRGKTEPHKKQKNPKNMKRIRKDIGEIEKEIVKEMKNDKKGRKKRIRNLKRKKKHLQQMLEQMEEHWNRHNPNKQRPNRNILIFDAPPSWFRL